MQPDKAIQHLRHHQINKQKWDECIVNAVNSLIYARSFYLDNMCGEWSALVGKDYDWVLPLTSRKKWGIAYLYQPPFTQQLGVFFKAGVNPPYKQIAGCMQQLYHFHEVSWNYDTVLSALPHTIHIHTATNYILPLSEHYKTITKNYHKDLLKNIKRSRQFNLCYETFVDYGYCINIYRQYYATRMPQVTINDFENFERLCQHAIEHQLLQCRIVKDSSGEIAAAALLLFDGKRLYNIMNTCTPTGRKMEANHYLLDSIIFEFATQNILLDFEGSDLPGVKTFYENFGAVNQPFYQLYYNNLPWPLHLFKKHPAY